MRNTLTNTVITKEEFKKAFDTPSRDESALGLSDEGLDALYDYLTDREKRRGFEYQFKDLNDFAKSRPFLEFESIRQYNGLFSSDCSCWHGASGSTIIPIEDTERAIMQTKSLPNIKRSSR